MKRVALMLVASGFASSAAAQPSCRDLSDDAREPADEMYRAATTLMLEEHYDAARALLEDVGRICTHPAILRDLAQALYALGRLVEARAAIARALEIADASRDRVVTDTGPLFLAEIEGRLGRLEFPGVPPHADIEIDCAPSEAAPDGVRWLDPGEHVVTIRVEGHELERMELSVAAGETTRPTLTLRPTSAELDGGLLASGLVIAIVGAGGLATGGGLFALREDEVRAGNAACTAPTTPGDCLRFDRAGSISAAHFANAEAFGFGMVGAFVGGGIALVTGVALMATSVSPRSASSNSARAHLDVSPAGARLTVDF